MIKAQDSSQRVEFQLTNWLCRCLCFPFHSLSALVCRGLAILKEERRANPLRSGGVSLHKLKVYYEILIKNLLSAGCHFTLPVYLCVTCPTEAAPTPGDHVSDVHSVWASAACSALADACLSFFRGINPSHI